MSVQREKFSTQMDSRLLAELRRLAKVEGRQLQSLVEEAVETMLAEKAQGRPSEDVVKAARKCMEKYSQTLNYLAK